MNGAFPPEETDDEIEALEIENRRLKRLMKEKLRSENEWLRSVLRRFEKMPVVIVS